WESGGERLSCAIGSELRGSDDEGALPHRRFEARTRLAARALAENGRHERQLLLAAGAEGDPGGGPRTRMDEIDPLGLENADEPADIERHGERISARGGKRYVQAADRLNFARQFRRVAGDQRPRARL